MGVSRTDYIVYGWKLPSDIKDKDGKVIDFWDEKFLPYIEGHLGVKYIFISDGMCGDYCVFGKKLNVQRDDEYEDTNFKELDISPSNLNSMEAFSKYLEVFGMGAETPPAVLVFSHFS
jgi:hypothetical protein